MTSFMSLVLTLLVILFAGQDFDKRLLLPNGN